ncbi:MAG: ABC transporter permease [Anaerolineales bacterium]|jgi:lipopolysaccharide transport system permease protein
MQSINEVITYRELISSWTWRAVRARYKQSVLGGVWAIIQPVSQAVIFTIIFTLFIPVDTGNVPYIVFSYTAMVPWILFSSSIADMVDSLVSNMNLVSKIYFPREILPLAALLARLVDFGIGYALLFLLIIIYRVDIFLLGWLFLPFVLLIQLALCFGLGLLGGALNVFYRDIRHVVILAIQILFYLTPIIYPVTSVPEAIRPYYYLNPMVGVIESYRAILLYQSLPGPYLWVSGFVAVLVLLFGYWFFKKVEFQFADRI